ncbi:MAG: arsenate reductase (glutaredoxin) [Flavobacteriaceae bacterium CG_4_8_14_3_um_filter_34_10]|nr:arsenate reductase (glutaredoxin) [Flavobacteriia bacterium]OIP52769.1 MAG: arsenate reductase (glutaredoxin) [Flavobacteriaceae bacterium CG2_30_34_30]PIQ18733.1 MAG: arsenate reductase (glutaredoxin) [Flavobacteriaceae bacterium CG18_big_fil_WC_8_21_14_2_50_34_36]PIV48361.1 MAG: arsenate reductase (glutaredoxin) [Flavobacteriaceae bacterium CG02_land_8_20_14_3_00_34_13]PIX10399.1 MAG: arsenate reductase (glutaredoxin) [Flavobacteriaceae bacterium CG_4_8_14_3_um_filter_34_10]PIZ08346.1 MAG
MLKIYHNPKCSKSREGLQILESSGKEYEVILYLIHPPSEVELQTIISKLGIPPIDLVRKGELIWKENYQGKTMTDKEIIAAMAKYPKLMERPIVLSEKKAVIGRPPENIKALV